MSRKKEEEERKKEKIMPSTMATYVYASSQGQRTHSARTKSNRYPSDITMPRRQPLLTLV